MGGVLMPLAFFLRGAENMVIYPPRKSVFYLLTCEVSLSHCQASLIPQQMPKRIRSSDSQTDTHKKFCFFPPEKVDCKGIWHPVADPEISHGWRGLRFFVEKFPLRGNHIFFQKSTLFSWKWSFLDLNRGAWTLAPRIPHRVSNDPKIPKYPKKLLNFKNDS